MAAYVEKGLGFRFPIKDFSLLVLVSVSRLWEFRKANHLITLLTGQVSTCFIN